LVRKVIDHSIVAGSHVEPAFVHRASNQIMSAQELHGRERCVVHGRSATLDWARDRGRIVIDTPSLSWADWLRLASSIPQLDILPLTAEVAIESEQFSNKFPSDPADRLICATARVHGLILLTSDRSILRAGEVATVW
jgi:PIN domain nuclease of toxin-antitoxin system